MPAGTSLAIKRSLSSPRLILIVCSSIRCSSRSSLSLSFVISVYIVANPPPVNGDPLMRKIVPSGLVLSIVCALNFLASSSLSLSCCSLSPGPYSPRSQLYLIKRSKLQPGSIISAGKSSRSKIRLLAKTRSKFSSKIVIP